MKGDIYDVILLQRRYPQSKILKGYLTLRLHLRERFRKENYRNKILRALMTPWYETEGPGSSKDQFATRVPPGHHMYGRSRCKYFDDKWEPHWEALDELLARDWCNYPCMNCM